jgi:hypothetical protein
MYAFLLSAGNLVSSPDKVYVHHVAGLELTFARIAD